MTVMQEFFAGIFGKNPVFRLSLGLVPAIGVTAVALNGVFLGLLTTAVLVLSLVGGWILRRFLPEESWQIMHVALLAVFTALAQRILVVYYPVMVVELGIFIPLIVVNAFVLFGMERRTKLALSLARGLGMGIGFTASLFIIGVVREFLGTGTVLGSTVVSGNMPPFSLAAAVPGGFLILGLLLALVNTVFGSPKEMDETGERGANVNE